MKPRGTVITLAVDNLERAVHFYREGPGLPTQGIMEGMGSGFAFCPVGPGDRMAQAKRKA